MNVLNYKIPALLLHIYLGQSSHAFYLNWWENPKCLDAFKLNWLQIELDGVLWREPLLLLWGQSGVCQACAPRCSALLVDTNLKEQRKWYSTITHSEWFPYKLDVEFVSNTSYPPYDNTMETYSIINNCITKFIFFAIKGKTCFKYYGMPIII